MASKEKQYQLERHRAILVAICNYLLQLNAGCLVFDDCDHIAEGYQQEIQRVEIDYQ